jgi:hypothetical protein
LEDQGKLLWFENLYIHGCKFGKPFDKHSGDQNNAQNRLRLTAPGLDKATILSCRFEDNFVGAWVAASSDIKDCLFEHAEWTGLWYVAASGGTISGNKFMHNCDQFVWCGVSASALAGVKNCVVEYNEFGETQVVQRAVDGEDLDFEAGCSNIVMRYNLFHESAGPASMLYNSADHNNPNANILIHDNVFLKAAINPSTATYRCNFLLSDGNTGAITNNRIYAWSGVPVFAGSACPGVLRTGNIECAIEDEPRGTDEALTATASASSDGRKAKAVRDNDGVSAWKGNGQSNQWVELRWPSLKTLNEFIVEQAPGSAIDNFVLQYWGGAGWKDIFTSYVPWVPASICQLGP